MTKSNGKPCKKCGTNNWSDNGQCKECKRAQASRWRRDNPDKSTDSTRRWQQANPDKVAEKSRRYRQNNPDRHAECNRRWAKNNPEMACALVHRRRTSKTQAGGSYTAAEFKALCDHYGNKCLCCKMTGVKLTADHIKPVSKGGHSNIDNIQPLCRSCNSTKHDKHIDYRPDAGPLRWLQCKLFG